MSSKRQKTQLFLAFAAESRDEFPLATDEGTELPVAKREAQSPTQTDALMEEECQRDNLWQALKRVEANQGAPGVDGMTVRKLPKYLKRHFDLDGRGHICLVNPFGPRRWRLGWLHLRWWDSPRVSRRPGHVADLCQKKDPYR